MKKRVTCDVKCVIKKNKLGNWDVTWNGKWMASFKFDWDAQDFVDKKTFLALNILDGINELT